MIYAKFNQFQETHKANLVISVLTLFGIFFFYGCCKNEQYTTDILLSNDKIGNTYGSLSASDIALLESKLSNAVIDASDGNDFNPGTYVIYKTSQGRHGQFIVEGLDKSRNNKLTIGWVTYNIDGSVYSSGSGLEIRGTWNCDLDTGKETSVDRDFHWQMKTSLTRNLNPRRGAIFSLMYRSRRVESAEAIPFKPTMLTHLPTVFAENLAVDGITVRTAECTADFVQSLLGTPTRKDARVLRYTDNNLNFNFSANGLLSEIYLNKGFKGRLDTGITLSSTKQEVLSTYGKPIKTTKASNLHRKNIERILYTKGDISRIYYGSHGLIFWFKGNAINQIVIFKGKMVKTGANEICPIPKSITTTARTLTLSDDALMSLEWHKARPQTASIINRRDVAGPGVVYDIYLPAGDSSITYLASQLINIEVSKYNNFGLKFTLLDIDYQSSGHLVFGAKCDGRYRPALIQKGQPRTTLTSFNSKTLSNIGFVVYRIGSDETNSPALKITLKVEPVAGATLITPPAGTPETDFKNISKTATQAEDYREG